MKLEVGKSYRNRRGEKRTIVFIVDYFVDEYGVTYRPDGMYQVSGFESSSDLIAEWTDEPKVVEFECEWISNDLSPIHPIGSGIRSKLQSLINKRTRVRIQILKEL